MPYEPHPYERRYSCVDCGIECITYSSRPGVCRCRACAAKQKAANKRAYLDGLRATRRADKVRDKCACLCIDQCRKLVRKGKALPCMPGIEIVDTRADLAPVINSTWNIRPE